MRDLVESVIDNILARERAQRPSAPKPAATAGFRRALDHAREAQQAPRAEIRHRGVQVTEPARHPDAKLWEASLKFESQFILQMLHAMRASIPQSGLLPHGFTRDVQDSMMDQAVADAASRRGEFGIAESIYRQMSRAGAGRIQEHGAPADIESMATSLNHPVDQATEAMHHAR